MSPRTGRPPKGENSRNINLNIRITEQEADDIKMCAEQIKMTRTDTIMKGVELLKTDLEKK